MLILSKKFQEQIYLHPCRQYPYECCGALLGTINLDRKVTEVVALDNEKASRKIPKEYIINTRDLLLVTKEAIALGIELIGFYHSHPDGDSAPSKTDKALAWEVYSYLIISTAKNDSPQFQSWRLQPDGSDFIEEHINK